jgi:hypothetical protein
MGGMVSCEPIDITVVSSDEQQNNSGEEIMTESKQRTKPASMPGNVPTQEYRLTREDYPELQRARNLVKLEKLKAAQYTNDQGLQDLRITYKLHDKVYEAQTLTQWGHVIALQLANKIEQWTPDQSVYALSEMLTTMRFCDPGVEADLSKLPTARIDKKLKGLVTIVDNAGFGFNPTGGIINCDVTLSAIEEAEKLGMKFVKE